MDTLSQRIRPHVWAVTLDNQLLAGDWNYIKRFQIKKIGLRFRKINISPLPEGCDRYFFANKILKFIGSENDHHFYVIGFEKNGLLFTQTYRFPDYTLVEKEIREADLYNDFMSQSHTKN